MATTKPTLAQIDALHLLRALNNDLLSVAIQTKNARTTLECMSTLKDLIKRTKELLP